MDRPYIPVIILHLSIVAKKHFIATITQLWSLELLTLKTPLLHMLYYMNWLTHDFWTRTGGVEFDRSHGAGTSSPSHWQQVEEQAPKPVGGMMSFLLMTFVPVQKLCVNIYIYIIVEKSPNSTIIAIIRACACWALFVVTLTNTVHFIYIYMYIHALLYEVCFLSFTNCVLCHALWW